MTSRPEWVLASRNRGKAEEFQRLLAPYGVGVVPLFLGPDDVVAEEGGTYFENAAQKARVIARRTGRVALADDSGLEVAALGGRPGLYSARYAGGDPDNLYRVLTEMAAVPWEERTALMRAVVVLAGPDGRIRTGEGVLSGRIAMRPRGRFGFGYDPAFLLADGRTLAERTPEEKDLVSHRRKALERLLSQGLWDAAPPGPP